MWMGGWLDDGVIGWVVGVLKGRWVIGWFGGFLFHAVFIHFFVILFFFVFMSIAVCFFCVNVERVCVNLVYVLFLFMCCIRYNTCLEDIR